MSRHLNNSGFNLLRIFVLVALIVLIEPHSIYSINQDTRGNDNEARDSGYLKGLVAYKVHYRNTNWLYSFKIPEGLTCFGDPPPNPNHGCGIDLSNNPKSYIWVDGSYNSLDSISPSDTLIRNLDPLLKEGVEILVLKRVPALLGGLQAERLTISYRNPGDQEPSVRDTVVAFRTVKRFGELIYTIGLICPKSRFEQDKKVFELIIASWINEPVR